MLITCMKHLNWYFILEIFNVMFMTFQSWMYIQFYRIRLTFGHLDYGLYSYLPLPLLVIVPPPLSSSRPRHNTSGATLCSSLLSVALWLLLPSRYDLGWHHGLPHKHLRLLFSSSLFSSFHSEDCSSFRSCPDILVSGLIYQMAVVPNIIEFRQHWFMIKWFDVRWGCRYQGGLTYRQ